MMTYAMKLVDSSSDVLVHLHALRLFFLYLRVNALAGFLVFFIFHYDPSAVFFEISA